MPSIFAWVSKGPLEHSACAVEYLRQWQVRAGETIAWNVIPARELRKPSLGVQSRVGN